VEFGKLGKVSNLQCILEFYHSPGFCRRRGRAVTRSGPPSPRTGLFTHACDVASASRAAIAFREVDAAHSVRPILSGQSLRLYIA